MFSEFEFKIAVYITSPIYRSGANGLLKRVQGPGRSTTILFVQGYFLSWGQGTTLAFGFVEAKSSSLNEKSIGKHDDVLSKYMPRGTGHNKPLRPLRYRKMSITPLFKYTGIGYTGNIVYSSIGGPQCCNGQP